MTKKILLEQFAAAYDENGWFVALKNALNNLQAEDAAWKADGAENSIWGIVAHLNFYNERWLKRFAGAGGEASEKENSETFADDGNASDADWRAESEKFERIMNGWRDALSAASEAKFSEMVSAENRSSWAEIVGLINTHNAHHGGQIVLLRKLQGSWDASKGVS